MNEMRAELETQNPRPKPWSADVVVARFAEPLDWLPAAAAVLRVAGAGPLRLFVYDKGPTKIPPSEFPTTDPRHGFTEVSLVLLPNVGRNDHTMLHHLIERRGLADLADVTLFMPGSCRDPLKAAVADRLLHLVAETRDTVMIGTPYRSLDVESEAEFSLDAWPATNAANRAANPETALLPCPERPFGAWFRKVFGDGPSWPRGSLMAWKGLFAVSREHALGVPAGLLETLLSYVDTHSNPEAGHYVERAWSSVFRCPPACVRYVSLGGIIADARRRGYAG